MSDLSAQPKLHRSVLTWFAAGFAMSAFLIWTQSRALGGLSGLLLVGETSELRGFIEGLLGDVHLTRSRGHDGQIYFAIAHDLGGETVAELIDNPGIRFRRPVMPTLTSLGGLLTGQAVLWSTAFWLSAGFGVSAVALRDLTGHFRVSSRWVLVLFLYPGFWMAARLLTPDLIALAMALSGLALFVRKRHWQAIILFTLAGLTKEVFVVIAMAAGTWAFFSRSQDARSHHRCHSRHHARRLRRCRRRTIRCTHRRWEFRDAPRRTLECA